MQRYAFKHFFRARLALCFKKTARLVCIGLVTGVVWAGCADDSAGTNDVYAPPDNGNTSADVETADIADGSGVDGVVIPDVVADLTDDHTGDTSPGFDIGNDSGPVTPSCPKGNLKGYACTGGGFLPWSGARVYAIGADCDGAELVFSTLTDSSGYFSFTGLPVGMWDINVTAVGFSQNDTVKISPGWTDLGPLNGGTCDQPPPPCTEGSVIGNLCPLGTATFDSAGVNVLVKTADCKGTPVEISSVSAPNGDFKIAGLPAGYAQLLVNSGNTANPWKSQAFVVTANKSTDLGQIGAISCGGKPPVPSGQVCDDPKLPDCEVCDCTDNNGNGVIDEGCPFVSAQDICDCADNDCDGLVDENCPGFSFDGCDCADSDCDGLVDEDCAGYPNDFCNQKDDDCDGELDEDCDLLDDCINPKPPFADCDNNGVPDQCPLCPSLDVVFVVDTSGSMDDELGALCVAYAVMVQALQDAGIAVHVELNGLGLWNACGAAQNIESNYPNEVTPPDPGGFTLNGCGDISENWAPATAVLASNHNWAPDAVRVIVPISDEGPLCGDPVTKEDVKSVHFAAKIATLHNVVVSPIVGTGAPPEVHEMAAQLAETTFGMWQATTDADTELVQFIVSLAAKACQAATDCNLNDVPDTCELAANPDLDCNGNEALDSCDIMYGKSLDLNEDDVPDECVP